MQYRKYQSFLCVWSALQSAVDSKCQVSTCYTDNCALIFQQNGAPFHTSRITRPSRLIKKHDRNSMDYAIWDFLKDDVYRYRAARFTEQELKYAIVWLWE